MAASPAACTHALHPPCRTNPARYPLDDGTVKPGPGGKIDIVARRQRDRGLEFSRQVGGAVHHRVSLEQLVEFLAIQPGLVIGAAGWQGKCVGKPARQSAILACGHGDLIAGVELATTLRLEHRRRLCHRRPKRCAGYVASSASPMLDDAVETEMFRRRAPQARIEPAVQVIQSAATVVGVHDAGQAHAQTRRRQYKAIDGNSGALRAHRGQTAGSCRAVSAGAASCSRSDPSAPSVRFRRACHAGPAFVLTDSMTHTPLLPVKVLRVMPVHEQFCERYSRAESASLPCATISTSAIFHT